MTSHFLLEDISKEKYDRKHRKDSAWNLTKTRLIAKKGPLTRAECQQLLTEPWPHISPRRMTRYELIQIITEDTERIQQFGLAVIDPELKKIVDEEQSKLPKKPMNSSYEVTKWVARRLLDKKIKGVITRGMPDGTEEKIDIQSLDLPSNLDGYIFTPHCYQELAKENLKRQIKSDSSSIKYSTIQLGQGHQVGVEKS